MFEVVRQHGRGLSLEFRIWNWSNKSIFKDTVIALEAIVDFAKAEEINTSRMVMHIVDENKKIDTFRLTQARFHFFILDYKCCSAATSSGFKVNT